MAIYRRPGHVIYTGEDRREVEVLVAGHWHYGEQRSWDQDDACGGAPAALTRRCHPRGMALDDWCDLDLAYLLLFDEHPDAGPAPGAQSSSPCSRM